jgi:hypothetical protein
MRGKPLLLLTYGGAIARGGFFNIEVEPLLPQVIGDVFAAVVQLQSKLLSESQLLDELKHLVDEAWDWQVAKVSETEFSVRFPSRETLRMSTRNGRIFLPLSQSEAKIQEAFIEVRPGKALPSVWVQISGLPKDLMTKECIMASLTMIGRPMDVDELSVKKHETEPVRVRFQCRHPDRIKGTVQLCVNGEPFTISLQAELGRGGGSGSGGGGPPKPPSREDDGAAEDSEEPSSELEPRHNRKNKDKQSLGSNGKGSGGSGGGGGSQVVAGSCSAPPLGRGAPLGLSQYGSNLPAFQFPPVAILRSCCGWDRCFIRHGGLAGSCAGG